jgi:hypothetical protein
VQSKFVPAENQRQPAVRRNGRPRWWIWLGMAGFFLILLATGWYYYFQKREISSSGGLYFPYELRLPVQRFAQSDPRWGDDSLGGTSDTLAGQGCAVSSAAMVLAFYGINLDPGRLNEFLNLHDGYTPEGWLRWEVAADFASGKARHAYEDLPSYFLIDSNLLHGNPVIIRLRLPSGVTHFVVIAGKRGFHYLIQDPASAGESGVYPLDELTPKIEALRFYQSLQRS